MTSKIIPLGFSCNVSFLSQDTGMKEETSLFEWLQSDKLEYITDIINDIKDKIDTNIIKGVDHRVHVLHENVWTNHYTLEEYKIIFERRAKRFLDIIKEPSKTVVFVRINPFCIFTTHEEIDNFVKAIISINPTLNIKFLIIHTISETWNCPEIVASKILNASVIQKTFLLEDCHGDVFLRNNVKIQEQFLDYLKECGIDTEVKKDKQFHDKD
jgi:branched-subunit amino acid transport protein AzlD